MRSQAEQAERLVGEAVAAGARVLGPRRAGDGSTFPPTALADVRPDMALCHEAPFAPILGVLPFDSEAGAVADNAACPYGLGASVFTADSRNAANWAERIGAGMVTVND